MHFWGWTKKWTRRMNKMLMVFLFVIYSQATMAGTAYRCGNVFSQTPCGENAKEQALYKGSADASDDFISVCLGEAKKRIQFKDPESLRVESSSKPTAKVIDYADAKIMVYEVVVNINGKNSYGAYNGAEPYICHLSQDKKRVLNILH